MRLPLYLLTGLEAVLQADGAVEYQMLGGGVLAVGGKVALTHELIALAGLSADQGGFHLTAGQNLQRIRIQAGQEILAGGIGISIVEQVVVLTDLGIHGGGGVDQWMVAPLTLRPSAGLPPLLSGS